MKRRFAKEKENGVNPLAIAVHYAQQLKTSLDPRPGWGGWGEVEGGVATVAGRDMQVKALAETWHWSYF